MKSTLLLGSVLTVLLIGVSPGLLLAQPLIIVDSNGVQVGTLLGGPYSGSNVARQINGIWVAFPFSQYGPREFGPSVPLQGAVLYVSSDCSGAAYLEASQLPVTGAALSSDPNVMSYPRDLQLLMINSSQTVTDGVYSACQQFPVTFQSYVGSISLFDFSTLGLVPPFRVQ